MQTSTLSTFADRNDLLMFLHLLIKPFEKHISQNGMAPFWNDVFLHLLHVVYIGSTD